MVSMSIVYQGDLHCELTHGPSKTKIQTDAPVDNQGRGESFSPTDLLGAALGSCILTTMAIVAKRDGIAFEGASAAVEKHMSDAPRKVARLPVKIKMPAGIPQDYRRKMQHVAEACPVHKSLHPDIEMNIELTYPD